MSRHDLTSRTCCQCISRGVGLTVLSPHKEGASSVAHRLRWDSALIALRSIPGREAGDSLPRPARNRPARQPHASA